jgi:hypothetical protein
MSNQINSAIELKSEELDLVAGGAITEQQAGSFFDKENALLSTFSDGPFGAVFGAKAINKRIGEPAVKFVHID